MRELQKLLRRNLSEMWCCSRPIPFCPGDGNFQNYSNGPDERRYDPENGCCNPIRSALLWLVSSTPPEKRRSNCGIHHKESCLATTRGHVRTGRIRRPNHRAAHPSLQQKRIVAGVSARRKCPGVHGCLSLQSFWKAGSPRKGSQTGSSLKSAGVTTIGGIKKVLL